MLIFLKKAINDSLGKIGYVVKRTSTIAELEQAASGSAEPEEPSPASTEPEPAIVAAGESPPERAPLPPIILITMQKSGTTFIRHALETGLNIEHLPFFPPIENHLNPSGIKQDNTILATHITHLAPVPVPLISLCLHAERFILHLRDPRNTCVSWMHHLDRVYLNSEGAYVSDALSMTGSNWANASKEEKLERCIKYYYPKQLRALAAWIEVLGIDLTGAYIPSKDRVGDSLHNVYLLDGQKIARQFGDEEMKEYCPPCRTQVLLTTHEDLACSGEHLFFNVILDFYGIPKDNFQPPTFNKDINVHFRTGRTDSWKTEFSPQQQKKVTEQLPLALRNFFSWE